MNYIKELNALFDYCILNDVSKSEISLLRALYAINNKNDWTEWFEADNQLVSRLTGGYSRQAIIDARNRLKQVGRIDFKDGKKNTQAPRYKIFSFCDEVVVEKIEPTTVIKGLELGELVDILLDKELDIPLDVLLDHLYKQNKTKQKETPPMSPKGEWEERFKLFWSAYPKKVGKGAAEKWFKKNKPSQSLVDDLLSAVELQKQSEQWQKNKGQFIPNPTTWLNQERWRDTPQVQKACDDTDYSQGDDFLDAMERAGA